MVKGIGVEMGLVEDAVGTNLKRAVEVSGVNCDALSMDRNSPLRIGYV